MIGTLVNCLAIILGTTVGLCIKGGLPEKYKNTIMNGLALCVIYIGIEGALKGINTMILIISIVIGSIIGEFLDIDQKIERLGNWIESKFKRKSENSKVAEAFVTSTLLFCVGAMAIVGSLESGLNGNNTTLFAKSALDGVSSIIFAASLGFGVYFSAIPILIYQGGIALVSGLIASYLTTSVISMMTSVGSLLIIALGFNMLSITKIKVGNLLPAILIPFILGLLGIL